LSTSQTRSLNRLNPSHGGTRRIAASRPLRPWYELHPMQIRLPGSQGSLRGVREGVSINTEVLADERAQWHADRVTRDIESLSTLERMFRSNVAPEDEQNVAEADHAPPNQVTQQGPLAPTVSVEEASDITESVGALEQDLRYASLE
jgi:hypothetical protein